MIDQLRYTARLVRWPPLGVVTLIALALGTTLRVGSAAMPTQLGVAVIGAIAASVALSLHDPAWELLGPVPISVGRRTALRVALAGPVALASWLVLNGLGRWISGTDLEHIETMGLVALIAAGVAATVFAHHRRPDDAATIGASVVLGWALTGTLAPEGPIADVSEAWIRQPWAVAALASTVAVLAARR